MGTMRRNNDGVAAPLWGLLASGCLGLSFVVTLASQHPNTTFDRLRSLDRTGVFIPNWRFFAPEPGRHDYHLLHRALTSDGRETHWKETFPYSARSWTQMLWFPAGRRQKAVYDICVRLVTVLREPSQNNLQRIAETPQYRILQGFVENEIRVQSSEGDLPTGFQFAIARDAGYEVEGDLDLILASHFIPLTRG